MSELNSVYSQGGYNNPENQEGFDLGVYRRENSFKVLVCKITNGRAGNTKEIFSGYTPSTPNMSATISTSDYTSGVVSMMNGLITNGVTKAVIEGITSGLTSNGEGVAPAFDSKKAPYITGVQGGDYTVTVRLPLLNPDAEPRSGFNSFKENIAKPINNLYYISLPDTEPVTDRVKDGIDKVINGLAGFVRSAKDEGEGQGFLESVATGFESFRQFYKDIKQLRRPIQCDPDVRVSIDWAGLIISDVIINTINVTFSDRVYSSDNGTLPQYADVAISFQSNWNPHRDNFMITSAGDLHDEFLDSISLK